MMSGSNRRKQLSSSSASSASSASSVSSVSSAPSTSSTSSSSSVWRDSGFEDVEFLLPNGFMVSLSCNRRSSLSEIKSILWEKAVQLPASNYLRDSEHYVFIGVTKQAVEEELDDSMTVEDLHILAKPILEVSEPKLTRDLNALNHTLADVIGLLVQTLDSICNNDAETKHLRTCLRQMCHPLARERETWSRDQNALFFHPPKLDNNIDLPICTARKIMRHPENKIFVNVWIQDWRNGYTLEVPAADPPKRVIEAAIYAMETEIGYTAEEIAERLQSKTDSYVLKVYGREEYMLQDCCIHTYEYVRNCINKDQKPDLQLVSKSMLLQSIPANKCVILHQDPPTDDTSASHTTGLTSWQLSTDSMYCIKVNSFPAKRIFQSNLYVQAQLFHGNQPLSKPMKTSESNFKQTWNFGVPIESLPRCARLCFVACSKEKEGGKKENIKAINWVNIQVFDHKRKLVTGRQVVRVTKLKKECSRTDHHLGTAGSNTDNITDEDSSELEFEVIPPCEADVYYPSAANISEKLQREKEYHELPQIHITSYTLLDRIVHTDPLKEMSKSEKAFLWQHRYLAMNYQPCVLPRVIQCVNWTNRHDVFKLYQLIDQWPDKELSLVTVFQLLGPEYPDQRVRSLAVKALDERLSNEHMEMFMLQLVQAVKLESYQHNELGRLLLIRALYNKNIGHRLFWYLRSELHNGLSRLRFAHLLEAFCMYCGSDILAGIQTEVKSLNEYRRFSRSIDRKNTNLEEQQTKMRNWLEERDAVTTLENQRAVLNQNIELGKLCTGECRIMSSKMRPMWMSWRKQSSSGDVSQDTVKYIVKDGDDLRQDMLVIQLIRLMDMIWKYSSHDYCITSYDCLSMDKYFGMIEVVCGAKTVCDIEMHKQEGVMSITSMHEWLYTMSEGGERYLEAVKRFTHSCAGFCVITYILGVGDRHSDNIMLKITGEFFHIDFGHFMNHRKTYLGIQRERSPFVLTTDFIRVVTKGSTDQKLEENADFQNFLYLCLHAYMTIRRDGALILTLLSLMMHCDLPELKDLVDINYCRECLALDKPDHEAANNFYEAILKSYKGSWKTKIDWTLHRVNRVMQGGMSSS